MTAGVVDYVIARDGVRSASGRAYDYILAGDGVFVAALNEDLEIRVRIAACSIRGLWPVHSICTLKHGRIPLWIWNGLLRCMRLAHDAARCEMLAGIAHDQSGYRIEIPQQTVGPVSVAYALRDGLVLEIHSHGSLAAHFSSIDSADEQRLRLYGVVGCLDRETPDVAIRAGAYGHFMAVPRSSVFEGDPEVVNDLFADPQRQYSVRAEERLG